VVVAATAVVDSAAVVGGDDGTCWAVVEVGVDDTTTPSTSPSDGGTAHPESTATATPTIARRPTLT